jgi:DNA-binding CsgD family transcriptional regulator
VGQPDVEQVLSGLYEAAALQDLWPTALDALARMTGSRGALVTRADRNHDGLLASPSLDAATAQFFEQGWHRHDLRTQAILPRIHEGFLGEQQMFTPEQIESADYYRDFARAADVPWFAAAGIVESGGAMLGISIQRSARDGAFDDAAIARLNALLPHVRGALTLAYRVARRRDEATLAGLEAIDQAAMLLGPGGTIRAVNALADRLMGTVFSSDRGLPVPIDPLLRRAFALMVGRACQAPAPGVTALPDPMVLRSLAGRPLLAQAVPLRGQAVDRFGDGRALLLLGSTGRAKAPGASVLAALFGLTPSEAKVAHGLMCGMEIGKMAQAMNVSQGAVRFHVKAVLAKAGVHRQSAFVALVSDIVNASAGDPS